MSVKSQPKKAGEWTLGNKLGKGGNGSVYIASKKGDEVTRAIKVLIKSDSKALKRFRDEINTVRNNSHVEGIIPIIDFYMPTRDAKINPAWYVMPIAKPAKDVLVNKSDKEIIFAIRDVAQTLLVMHRQKISHRDIKPDNILFYETRFCLSDWGLVDYPGKLDITGEREGVGPKFFMAPEMRRFAYKADGLKADVYSLAKTLWAFLTHRWDGFDGQYQRNNINGLNKYKNKQTVYLKPIGELLAAATSDDPSERPSISEFVVCLDSWLQKFADISQQELAALIWKDIHEDLTLVATPDRTAWESPKDIVEVINMLSRNEAYTHIFYPDSGGMHFSHTELSKSERGCIEIFARGSTHVFDLVKPKRLISESIVGAYE